MNIVIKTDDLMKNKPLPTGLTSAHITVLSSEGKSKQKMSMEDVIDLINTLQKQNVKMESISAPLSKEALMLYLGSRATGKGRVYYVSSDKNLCKTINDSAKALNLADRITALQSIKAILKDVPAAAEKKETTKKTPSRKRAQKEEKKEEDAALPKLKKAESLEEVIKRAKKKAGNEDREDLYPMIPGQVEITDFLRETASKRAEKTEEATERKRGRKPDPTLTPEFEDILNKARVKDDIAAAGQDYRKIYKKIWSAVAASPEVISFDVQLRVKVLDAKLTKKLMEKLSPMFKDMKEIVGEE